MSRLADQIREAVAVFAEFAIATATALIGELALAAHKVVRATRQHARRSTCSCRSAIRSARRV